VVVAQEVGDRLLGSLLEQAVLHEAHALADQAPIRVVIAGDQQQPVAFQRRGGVSGEDGP